MKPSEYHRLKRNKFNAVRTVVDGINFPSKAQAEFYQYLKMDPDIAHIDHEVPVTLPGGIRYRVDFVAWDHSLIPKFFEVKGKETADFKLKRKLFDQFHPGAPLRVYRKVGKGWVKL